MGSRTPLNLEQKFTRLREIGTALSNEDELDRLLELIVEGAEELTNADGGTLYTYDEDEGTLAFQIIRNFTLKVSMGGTKEPITWPPVKTVDDAGEANMANVSAAAVNLGETINIPDVYDEARFDFNGTKDFDNKTGYRSQSMIVVPMRDHLHQIIGILQLLNAQDAEGNSIPFNDDDRKLIEALASQAAVAITNTRLVRELKGLLEAFIKSIAGAIDAKSQYTGGHIARVTQLTMLMANGISEQDAGMYEKVHFSDDELEEIRISALLHDIGKIVTPEYVVDKSKKLETIYDRIGEVKMRFELMKKDREIAALKAALGDKAKDVTFDVADIEDDQAFVEMTNTGGEFMKDEYLERIDAIAKHIVTINGEKKPLLTDDEAENLKIRKGTLNGAERQIIEDHATHSINMLTALPFPKNLRRVPEIAGGHHEKLDGSGYPKGLKAEDLDVKARILAVADIFEALTAKDRPYKKPMPLSQAVKIMGFMIKDGHIDGDIFDLFVTRGLLDQYAKEALAPNQIDEYQYPF